MLVFILEHTEKPRPPERIAIDKDEILVGRQPDAELYLADTGVSKRHLVIRRTADGYAFEDLGSQNGTFINDVRQSSGPLRHRDAIRVGRMRLTVLFEGAGELPIPGRAAPPATAPAADAAASPPPAPGIGAPPAPATALLPSSAPAAPAASAAPATDRRRRAALAIFFWPALILLGFGVGLSIASLNRRDGVETAGGGGSSVAPVAAEPSPAAPGSSAPDISPRAAPALARDSPSSAAAAGVDVAPRPERFPGLAADPLGAYATREESDRVLYRLYLDLLERTPTRAEFHAARDSTHRQRWDLLRAAAGASAQAAGTPAEVFLLFLGREPNAEERSHLDGMPHEALAELGLWVTATREYRAASHRRERSLRQLSRSLLVDLQDRPPGAGDAGDPRAERREIAAIEDAILVLPDLGEAARCLIAAAAPETLTDASLDDAVRRAAEEVFRFLGRIPEAPALAEIAAAVQRHPQGLGWLRQALALSEEYWRY
jgi:hypothetical protein